jgi:hypothetical protein
LEILGKKFARNTMANSKKIDDCETCRWIEEKKQVALSATFSDAVLESLTGVEIEHINRFHFEEKKR